jgi:hypothetical protein
MCLHNLGLLAAARVPEGTCPISFPATSYGCLMEFANTKDETLLRFYEGVRKVAEIEVLTGSPHPLAGNGVKQYAERLRDEMDRRRLRFTPIDWR